jgi:hypothetical protein
MDKIGCEKDRGTVPLNLPSGGLMNCFLALTYSAGLQTFILQYQICNGTLKF